MLTWFGKTGPDEGLIVFHLTRKVIRLFRQVNNFAVVGVSKALVDQIIDIKVHR